MSQDIQLIQLKASAYDLIYDIEKYQLHIQELQKKLQSVNIEIEQLKSEHQKKEN